MACISTNNRDNTHERIQHIQQRCEQILECKHQIEYWKAKLHVLEAEQTTCIKLARLGLDASTTWRSLTRRERVEKPFILAAMKTPHGTLPSILAAFPNSTFPPHIRLDREILLARVHRSDFGPTSVMSSRGNSRLSDDAENGSTTTSTEMTERCFLIPPRLRGDKEVILAILPKYSRVIEYMSEALRDDEEVLDTLLEKHPGASLPSNFIQHFSDRIRSSKKIMLHVVANHPNGLSVLAFCGQDCQNDKDFVLELFAICKGSQTPFHSSTQILRHVSHRLRADRDVVYLAVGLSGLNLKHAAYHLRRDKEIVFAAVQEDGNAFRYCLPGPGKDELLKDRNFVLSTLQRARPSHFKNYMDLFETDRAIQMEAVVAGMNVPTLFHADLGFLKAVLHRLPSFYIRLPESIQEDFDVALTVVHAEDVEDEVLLEAADRCPQLLSNRGAMMCIAKKGEGLLSKTLQFSPVMIRNDKALMLQAIQTCALAYEYCTEELKNDRDIILAAMPYALYLVPRSYQMENPDIVIMAIEKTETNCLWVIYDHVYHELWSLRGVAQAWLAKGGDWLDDFAEDFEEDEELLLTLTKHNWSEFECVSEILKNDKSFMQQALQLDARVMRDISEDLRHDYDLVLAAFCRDVRTLQFYSGAEDFEFMVTFSRWIRDQLQAYDEFSNEVGEKISAQGPTVQSDSISRLSMLNQGPEVATFYISTLTAFLGLPCGNYLCMLKDASNNLMEWGL